MNSIVTFYSYKGGVGRSMALANIAVLLARRGLRVLTVDWDLEAPGLERYFSPFEISRGGSGLLRMCIEARDTGTADYKQFTSTFDAKGTHPVTLLASGRETDELYTKNLETFDWEAFFAGGGGEFVERLRDEWRRDFDVTLIDSRTGLSDTGGICTIQLPDIVVSMFTANLQSLYGARDVMRLAQQARQTLAYDRAPLTIFPLATRWGVQEFQETQIWLDRVAEATKEFFDDWLPKNILPRDVLEAVKIPQVAYFGFGERLAVVEQGTSDPQGMGFAYDKIASFIASDFAEIDTLVGTQKASKAAPIVISSSSQPASPGASAANVNLTSSDASVDKGYLHDVFFSYDTTMSDVVLELTDYVKQALSSIRKEPVKTFIDLQELRVGEAWATRLSESLLRSKVLVAFMTPRYVTSQFASNEYFAFKERARLTGKPVLFPVLLRGDDFPDGFREVTWLDLRNLLSEQNLPKRSLSLSHGAQSIADQLSAAIDQAPPFDPAWQALSEGVYGQTPIQLRSKAIEERLMLALMDDRYQWRTLDRVAAGAGVVEDVAADHLRRMPSVTFAKGKSGKIIVGLTERVRPANAPKLKKKPAKKTMVAGIKRATRSKKR